MKKHISKVAVIGSGIMGSGIACHMANIGLKVLLLDISPNKLEESEQKKGLSLDDRQVRNRLVTSNFERIVKSSPSPLYHKSFKDRISLGNIQDDLNKIANVDWVIEVVIERLDIKQQIFEQIEQYRTPGTLITSNTSGIPIGMMSKGRSDDFQEHFCGTHFFNPPRYLKLFEIIPGPKTKQEVLNFFDFFGDKFLGKTTVLAKDTPAFIGNRIGIFSIMNLFHQVSKFDLGIEDVDLLTGPLIGRPKSATFRTVDVVGLDTLVHVANGLFEHCKDDEENQTFKLPNFINTMIENNWLGSKTKGGFYKKQGKDILALNLKSLDYHPKKKSKFTSVSQAKALEELKDRYQILIHAKDKAGEFYRNNFASLFAYVANRIPEIADSCFKIDDAMKAGFGWQDGPFELWDTIGLENGVKLIEDQGLKLAPWVDSMINSENKRFYTIKNGLKYYYDTSSKTYKEIPGQKHYINLNTIRPTKTLWSNQDSAIQDLGDGIINFEFRSKMNTIGAGVIHGLNHAIDLAESKYNGLIIGNHGENYSVGANLALILMMAAEQDFDELNMAIKSFQDTVMRVKYSSIPVVATPFGMTFGGGCELTLHADRVVAAAETYTGLVEFGVGLIPGGGGTKEMTLRAAEQFRKNDVELNTLQEHFLTIAMAKVSTSAYEAFDLGIYKPSKDTVVVNSNRQLAVAKQLALQIADQGYIKPLPKNNIKVLGKQALGMFYVGTDSMLAGKYISPHDKKIANKLAYIMAGGDLSSATYVNEQYLLDLEREAFLSLCGERKTLERIEHMLNTGKPLRN